jgi:carbon storage regulator
MLVLSRKKDEKIIIGDSISIMVIDIRGDKVRLGIDAPRDVSVHRREVYEAIKKESEKAQEAERNPDSGLSVDT